MTKTAQNVTGLPGYMTPADAHATVTGQIQLPVFFEKLAADWGIVPQSEEEAVSMLKMAADLRVAAAKQQEKAASSRLGAIQQMQSALSNTVHGTVQAPAISHQIKSAASQVAQNPAIARALLAIMHQPT